MSQALSTRLTLQVRMCLVGGEWEGVGGGGGGGGQMMVGGMSAAGMSSQQILRTLAAWVVL
jgi:hypothetical protein